MSSKALRTVRVGPLSWNVTTGLDEEQVTTPVAGIHPELQTDPTSLQPGQLSVSDLYRSVVPVLFLLRQNPVQQVIAELFGVSQATVSRRCYPWSRRYGSGTSPILRRRP